ncbi:hypothetical protein [Fuerstiella marisgermanici]|uniref:PhoD-like phosphatase n=1 Tax=Fuerstiella marisgermanici TaxID=1891926 RepID=A0A1P8WGB5_9PLAN|nr:hypothetical protein [Fuerstiella marisgermanici]APZ93098.1 PhoD-like phosphatase [Fuerstiella marisgermanici]
MTRYIFLALLPCLLLPSPASGQQRNRNMNAKWPFDIHQVAIEDSIVFAPYTVHNGVMKMTVQLFPLPDDADRDVVLSIKEGGEWKEIGREKVSEELMGDPQGELKRWNAHFRTEDWDSSQDYAYRVTAAGGKSSYEGTIRRDPIDKKEIVIAAFTGNSNRDRRLKPDIIANIKAQDPDLLFFSGDQSYDHKLHFQAWLLFGLQFGDIIKDRPIVCLPDDHDIGQGNVWGENGVKAPDPTGNDGGYFYSTQYVNSVQDAQTWHMPDPYDPTPAQRGIGVYYTDIKIGRVSFAIIEDRKFKTGPNGVIPQLGPRPDHINDPSYDRQAVDLPDARLYGERQLKFLRDWATQWDGVDFKATLSQTVLANAAHRHGKYPNRLLADLDSNGWPQHGRNKALVEIRKAYGFMLAGDQHLATVVHHGINQFGDSGYSFCVPSVVNYYNRWWEPLEGPEHKIEGPLPDLGDYYDGFGNKMTMYAYANPDEARRNKYGGEWGERAAGYGLVRFDTGTRKITMECWPRGVDVTAADAEQYPGWPITIDQVDNYGRNATAYLPTLKFADGKRPVIQVVDETYGDIVYTLRVPLSTFQPKVFRDADYTIHVIDGDDKQSLEHVTATRENSETLEVK